MSRCLALSVSQIVGSITGIVTVALLSEQHLAGWPCGVFNTAVLACSSIHYKM